LSTIQGRQKQETENQKTSSLHHPASCVFA
jgi:hypothetical protein